LEIASQILNREAGRQEYIVDLLLLLVFAAGLAPRCPYSNLQ